MPDRDEGTRAVSDTGESAFHVGGPIGFSHEDVMMAVVSHIATIMGLRI